VVYMGTDEQLADVRYLPLINGDCEYALWRELYHDKRQFSVQGSLAYRTRWVRARLLRSRLFNVAISAGGAVARPQFLRRTLESSFVADKLVWAGNCYLDFAALGMPDDQGALELAIAAVRGKATPDERLAASLELIERWQTQTVSAGHQAFYVTN